MAVRPPGVTSSEAGDPAVGGPLEAERYPFGSYGSVELDFPIQICAWAQVRDDVGVGFFFEAVALQGGIGRLTVGDLVVHQRSVSVGIGDARSFRGGRAPRWRPGARWPRRG